MWKYWKSNRVHPQDGPRSWLVCTCAAQTNTIFCGFGLSIGVIFPTLVNEFKASRGKTAWVGSIAIGLSCSLAPISGSLCDRFGCRAVTICGSLVCSVSLLASSFVTHLELLYFTYGILFGIGFNFTYTPSLLVVSAYFTKWRSLALCLLTVGIPAGLLIFGSCVQLMLDAFGWRDTFRVMAGVSFAGVLLGCTYDSTEVVHLNVEEGSHTDKINTKDSGPITAASDLHDKENGEVVSNEIIAKSNTGKGNMLTEKNQIVRGSTVKFQEILKHYCSVWRVPMYTIIVLSSTLASLSQYIPYMHMVKHAQELHFSADFVADLYIYLEIASFVSIVCVGIFIGLNIIQDHHMYQACLIAYGSATLFLPMIKDCYGLVGYVLLFGACDGIFWAVLTVIVLNSVEAKMRSTALGMQMFLSSIALLLGPPLAGRVADMQDSYIPVFYMSGTISIVSGLMVFCLHCFKARQTVLPIEEDTVVGVDVLRNPLPAWLGSNGELAEVVRRLSLTDEIQHPLQDTKPRTSNFTAEYAMVIRRRTLTSENVSFPNYVEVHEEENETHQKNKERTKSTLTEAVNAVRK